MPEAPPRSKPSCGWAAGIPLFIAACVLVVCVAADGSELRRSAIVRAVEQARPSVVNIRGEKTVAAALVEAGQGEGSRRVNGMGTGVVIDPRGYILTNHHVVDGVRQIQVTVAAGPRHVARLLARDLRTDLALIKIDADQPLPVIPTGTSSDLMTGEEVVAVGNAYGYEHTVTRGIISALHRAVQVNDAQFYDDLIQTDASINPGNSGGPLLNIDGEMIGINVAVRAGAQGIGFAIPADQAMQVAAKLLARAGAKRAWHGVASVETPSVETPSSETRGVLVGSVDAGSPAAECGLKSGDAITAVDDQEVRRPIDFQRAMLERDAAEQVEMAVRRDGESLRVSLKLAVPPQWKPVANGPYWDALGLELKPISSQQFQREYETRYRGGLMIVAVRPDSPAATQGIRPGDVLVGMHVWETITLENVSYILKRPDFAGINPVKFFILRDQETLFGFLPVVTKTARR